MTSVNLRKLRLLASDIKLNSPYKKASGEVAPLTAKILVLDDSRYMRELMRVHLDNAGYEVLLAEDAVVDRS